MGEILGDVVTYVEVGDHGKYGASFSSSTSYAKDFEDELRAANEGLELGCLFSGKGIGRNRNRNSFSARSK